MATYILSHPAGQRMRNNIEDAAQHVIPLHHLSIPPSNYYQLRQLGMQFPHSMLFLLCIIIRYGLHNELIRRMGNILDTKKHLKPQF